MTFGNLGKTMMTDYDILHISETKDISVIKEAYRKIVKEIHPDVTDNSNLFKNHLLFIQVNQAYQRLCGQAKKRRRNIVTSSKLNNSKISGLVQHKDPAYAFYKTAMKFFMKIHPSQWNIEVKQIMEKPNSLQEPGLKKIQEKVKNLVKLFPKAYYYFSIVVHEYSDSVWFQDSKEKMILIEERTIRYKKIIESFTEHAKIVPRVNRMF